MFQERHLCSFQYFSSLLPRKSQFSLQSSLVVKENPIFSRKTLSALAFSPDGKLIVTGEVGATYL